MVFLLAKKKKRQVIAISSAEAKIWQFLKDKCGCIAAYVDYNVEVLKKNQGASFEFFMHESYKAEFIELFNNEVPLAVKEIKTIGSHVVLEIKEKQLGKIKISYLR